MGGGILGTRGGNSNPYRSFDPPLLVGHGTVSRNDHTSSG
jgi:hypothetical protein